MYFVEEQEIDPLNKSTLGAEAFRVYQQKRLLREVDYRKLRDTSFDFMQLGENDSEQFDDHV